MIRFRFSSLIVPNWNEAPKISRATGDVQDAIWRIGFKTGSGTVTYNVYVNSSYVTSFTMNFD